MRNDASSVVERYLDATNVWDFGAAGSTPAPLAMGSSAMGGYVPDGTAGITNASGAYNLGLLVKLWGAVTFVSGDFFYLDDGAGLQDGDSLTCPIVDPATGQLMPTTTPPPTGVLVSCYGMTTPCAGDYAQATGIAGAMEVMQGENTSIVRPCLRVRSQADLVTAVPGPGPQPDSYETCYKPPPVATPGDRHFVDSTGTVIPLGSMVRLKNAMVVADPGSLLKVVHTYGQTDAGQYVDSADNPLYLDSPGTWSLVDTPYVPAIHSFVTITGTTSAGDSGDQIEPDSFVFDIVPACPASGNPASLVTCQSLAQDAEARVARMATPTLNEEAPPWPPTGPTTAEIIADPLFQAAYNAPGAIGWALSQSDDSIISLMTEGVSSQSTDGCTLGLREWFGLASDPPALVLVLNTPVPGLTGASIDIVGATLTTLAGGQRALVNPQAVYAYVNADGSYAPPVPFKGAMTPSPDRMQVAP